MFNRRFLIFALFLYAIISIFNRSNKETHLNDNTDITYSRHALERMEQRNVSENDVSDAIKNPIEKGSVEYENGRPKQKFIGRKATVILNPKTKHVITVWQTSPKYRTNSR